MPVNQRPESVKECGIILNKLRRTDSFTSATERPTIRAFREYLEVRIIVLDANNVNSIRRSLHFLL